MQLWRPMRGVFRRSTPHNRASRSHLQPAATSRHAPPHLSARSRPPPRAATADPASTPTPISGSRRVNERVGRQAALRLDPIGSDRVRPAQGDGGWAGRTERRWRPDPGERRRHKASWFSGAAPWLLRRAPGRERGRMRESKHGRCREPKLLPPACPLHGSSSLCDHIQLQLLQKDVNLLNPMAELEKHSQEEASRAVHQLIIVEDFKEFLDDVMSGDGPWGEEEVLSHWPLLARPADPEIAPPHENVRVSSAAAPFRPRAPIPSLPPPSIYSAVPVLDLRSPNPDEIGRFHPISRQTQPQLLVGHAGSTDELLIDVHPAAPPTTVPSLLDSAPPTCRTIGLSSILARVKLATVKMQNSCNSILLQLSGAEGVRSNSAGGQTGSALGHATINAR
ncbi:uncharacterized protein [Triticum aestivum]|uniref:uncharacterized protein isoform X2 n=1 Tax=Triticum aestivum TaxID=4565 RepID=UPI001D00C7B5|nr:uncharacterized protein LOC123044952 isoform X2 [Triticum aestivum]